MEKHFCKKCSRKLSPIHWCVVCRPEWFVDWFKSMVPPDEGGIAEHSRCHTCRRNLRSIPEYFCGYCPVCSTGKFLAWYWANGEISPPDWWNHENIVSHAMSSMTPDEVRKFEEACLNRGMAKNTGYKMIERLSGFANVPYTCRRRFLKTTLQLGAFIGFTLLAVFAQRWIGDFGKLTSAFRTVAALCAFFAGIALLLGESYYKSAENCFNALSDSLPRSRFLQLIEQFQKRLRNRSLPSSISLRSDL